MLGTVHLLTGAMLGATITEPVSLVALAFFSHYLLDFLPHIDPETFTDRLSFTWQQTTVLVLDTVSTVLFALIFYLNHDRWTLILLGGLAAQLPDLMIPLQKYEWFTPLRRFHELWHWKKERAEQWGWYVVGLCSQVVVGVMALLVIWR